MEGPISTELSQEELAGWEYDAKDYLVSHGILARTVDRPASNDVVQHHSVTLVPSPMPKHIFEQACDVQTDYNLLMYKISRDKPFLKECLQNVIKVDDFTRRLWEIYDTVTSEGPQQKIFLMVNRNDYMLDCGVSHEDLLKGKNVDVYSKCRIMEVPHYAMGQSFIYEIVMGANIINILGRGYMLECMGKTDFDSRLPPNNGGDGQSGAIVAAFNEYGNDKAAIMYVVIEVERNIYDHRWLEYHIHDKLPNVRVIRRTMKQLRTAMKVTDDHRLIVDGMEIAVVYFRTCYEPKLFADEKDWEIRLDIERSLAVKQPDVGSQLAGTKKVQQVLAQPGMVERYLDKDAASRVRATFAGQYTLDKGDEGDKNAAQAIENPHQFVMKPQLEGGGNNLFGDEIKDKLTQLGKSDERSSYILMEKIAPTPLQNYPIKVNTPSTKQLMVSEIGIFGNLVTNGDKIVLNDQQGYLMRTKTSGVNEGGVATGFSFCDSAYLI